MESEDKQDAETLVSKSSKEASKSPDITVLSVKPRRPSETSHSDKAAKLKDKKKKLCEHWGNLLNSLSELYFIGSDEAAIDIWGEIDGYRGGPSRSFNKLLAAYLPDEEMASVKVNL